MGRRAAPARALVVLALVCSVPARADKSGVRPNVIDLPHGPGSVSGLGEQFAPDLHHGSAQYSVPLLVPPGTAGLAPSLGLHYDSGQGNGPLGVGWSLPTAAIQRQTDHGLPRYGVADRFLFNGQELVPLGNGVYRSRVEGAFMRFRQSAGGDWEADGRDGTLYRFGVSPGARLDGPAGTFRWALELQVDVWGNKLVYGYRLDRGQLYPSSIQYNARQGAADHSVLFAYEPRPDALTDYRAGFAITTALRLKQIRMLAGSSQVRRYELGYAATAGLSHLSAVTLFGTDDATALPTLSFSYTAFSPQATQVSTLAQPPAFSLEDGNTELVDFDGDSLPDLLHTELGNHRVAINQGTRFGAPQTLVGSPSIQLITDGVELADMDGDGLADLVAKLAGGTADFYYFPNRGQLRWEAPHPFSSAPAFSFEDPTVKPLDLDGDGLTDVLQTTSSNFYGWRNNGDGSWGAPVTLPVVSDGSPVVFTRSDVRLADMNGDRLVDLVSLLPGLVRYWPNTGFGRFAAAVQLSGAPDVGADSGRLQLADLNGDGLADLVLASGTQLDTWLQQADGSFAPRATVTGLPSADPATTVVRLADMNGSGTLDVVWNTPGGASPWQYLDLSGGVRSGLLHTISNGLGRQISVDYASSGVMFQQARAGGTAWTTLLPVATQVVAAVTTSDGRGWSNVEQFTYRDGFYEGVTRQFRGFARTTRVEPGDLDAPTAVVQYDFDVGLLDQALDGAMLGSEVRTATGVVLQRETSTYALHLYATGVDGRPVAGADRIAHETEFVEGSTTPLRTREEWTYDDQGDALTHSEWGLVSSTGDVHLGNDERVLTTEYSHDLSRWLLGRPTHVTVADANGTVLSERRSYFDGAPFVGLPLGALGATGSLTRTEAWVRDADWVDTERRQYDAFGNVVATLDARGNRHEVDYDAATHVLPVAERTLLADHALAFGADYDVGRGLLTAFTDSNGAVTRYAYDALGRLMAVVKPGDTDALPTIRYRYLLALPVSSVVTEERPVSGADAVVQEIEYEDGLGRSLGCAVQAEGGRWVLSKLHTFSARGTVVRQWDNTFASGPQLVEPGPEVPVTRSQVDELGRTVRSIFPDGRSAEWRFSPLAVESWDAEDLDPGSLHFGTPMVHRSDGLGRTVSVLERLGSSTLETRFGFDALDRRVSVINAKGSTATYAFDGLGRLTEVNHPDAGRRHYEWDPDGNLLSAKDARGQTVAQTFDQANRVVTEQHLDASGNPSGLIRYHYDVASPRLGGDGANALGRLGWVEDLSGEEHFRYDVRGRMTSDLRMIDGQPYRTDQEFDNLDRVVGLGYPDGAHLDYQFNERNLLAAVPGVVTAIAYNAQGQAVRREYSNGVVATAEYDEHDRVKGLAARDRTGLALQGLTYAYDHAGTLLTIEDSVHGAGALSATRSFGYDDLYRLTSAQGPTGSRAFAYDEVGNLRSKGGQGDYLYDASSLPDAVRTVGGKALTYDADGSVATAGDRRFTYDARGQLRRVDTAETVTEFDYDFAGQRVRKRVTAGSTVHQVLYVDRFSEVRDGRSVDYVFAGSARLARIEPSVSAGASCALVPISRGLSGGALLAFLVAALGLGSRRSRLARSSLALALCLVLGATACQPPPTGVPVLASAFYVTDALGSSELLTDGAGKVVSQTAYDAWGAQQSPSSEPYAFTGSEWDQEAGLYAMGVRHYDPELGRFLEVDSAALQAPERSTADPQSLNPYSYARNTPTSLRDRTGEFAHILVGALVGAAINTGIYLAKGAVTGESYTWRGALAAAGSGAVAGAVTAATAGAGLLVSGALSSVAGGVVERGITTGSAAEAFDGKAVLMDAATSVVMHGATKAVGAVVGKVVGSVRGRMGAATGEVVQAIESDVRCPSGTCNAGGRCFEAGTLVATEEGLRPIEALREGDRVLSRTTEEGALEYQPVVRRFVTPDRPLRSVVLVDPQTGASDTLHVTDGHPFWVRDAGWVTAEGLTVGMEVASATGGWLRVGGNTWEQRRATVYNFEVANSHTYFVGVTGAWVHNACKLWSETPSKSSTQNAFDHWKKHQAEFPEFNNAKEYVEGAHAFVGNPPKGALSKVRPNGDTVIFDQATNTFGVQAKGGSPKTLFRPDPAAHGLPTNLDYFNAQ